jgi:hypothetical protein
MHLQKLFVQALLLLAVPTAVTTKVGGWGITIDTSDDGGDFSIDSEDITSLGINIDTSSNGSWENITCQGSPQGVWYRGDVIPKNAYNWTTNVKGNDGDNPTTYDGSFFQGDATMQWRFTPARRCRNNNNTGTLRMRAYAWVGPQPPYPKGPTNPIIIGLNAWATAEELNITYFDFDFLDYDDDDYFDSLDAGPRLYCPNAELDLIKFHTSAGWTPRSDRDRAQDVVDLDLFPDSNSQDTVLFNGSMVPDLHPATSNSVKFLLPGAACYNQSLISLRFPMRVNLTGSLTNTTLEMQITGEGNVSTSSARGESRAMFNLTFSGMFDSANSTRAVAIKQDTQPMVFWVDNGGINYGSGRMLKLMFMWWIFWFVLDGDRLC